MKNITLLFLSRKYYSNRKCLCKIGASLAFILPLVAVSQHVITGKVFDAANNKPLALATVITKPGNLSTVSADDGTFTLQSDATEKTKIISYAGFVSRVIKITGTVKNNLIGLQLLQNETAVTVIGSRNAARTNVQTPVPVDVIPVARMAREMGQTDLSQLVTYAAPSFQSARQAVADGTDHIDPAQLRGLGSDQVLVLPVYRRSVNMPIGETGKYYRPQHHKW